jgi:hypothetical protein
MSYLAIGIGIIFGAFILGFILYFVGRMLGLGIAKSWFEMHENLKHSGGQNNGKDDCEGKKKEVSKRLEQSS